MQILNITRVSPRDYAGALLAAGVTDASVTVAAPEEKPVSGETAPVGALKAAALCLNQPLDPAHVDDAYRDLGKADFGGYRVLRDGDNEFQIMRASATV